MVFCRPCSVCEAAQPMDLGFIRQLCIPSANRSEHFLLHLTDS
uniref:Uncharacterized protein n=1 Tax=Arundo donax TaxID=35708 RepID=A0A0A9DVJ3_ARUDO